MHAYSLLVVHVTVKISTNAVTYAPTLHLNEAWHNCNAWGGGGGGLEMK